MSSVSGLSAHHRQQAKARTVQAATLGLHNANRLHYTQGSERWRGIDAKKVAARGQFPTQADCSSFATWCLWNGLFVPFGVRDTVNGARWEYGYTGTMVQHGKRVVHRKNVQGGDLAVYGDPTGRTGHVAVCVGGGRVVSCGAEPGPFLLPIDYRSDLREIRRFI